LRIGGTAGRLDAHFDTLAREFFPNPALRISHNTEISHAAIYQEYFRLLDSLTVKTKRARTLPEDSDTDVDREVRVERRKMKMQKNVSKRLSAWKAASSLPTKILK
jgi:hypothetical protein